MRISPFSDDRGNPSYIGRMQILTPAFFFFACILTCRSPDAFSQAALPALQQYNRPNPEPAPPGDTYNPPMTGKATEAAPACAEWTRTAAPDESVVIAGNNFSAYSGDQEGKDAKFMVYGAGGLTAHAAIQRLRADKAILTLGKELPEWSMYLIWPGNEKGYGYPVAINQTDAWWVGPDAAAPGSTVSVYGRNLSHNNGSSSSNIYLKAANGQGRWASVTGVNPYKVDFTVPADFPEGDYEVWAHNGHGSSYGWSGPLRLHVGGSGSWGATVFNVQRFGARGDGFTDDLQSIRQALAAAGREPGSTVYFPGGTYMVSNTLEMSSNTRWEGEGKNATTIKCAPDFSSDALGLVFANVKTAEIKGIAFEGNGNFRGKLDKPIFLRGSSDLHISDAKFFFPGYNLMDLHLCNRIFISNTEQTGNTSFLGNCSQLFIEYCDFRLTNESDGMLYTWGGAGISITHSTCTDYNNSDPGNGAGWGKGRFFVAEGNWGSNRLTYLGDNTTTDLGVRPAGADQNSGEQFLWEGNITEWSGSGSATATTLSIDYTFPNENTRYAAVIKGKGLGQSRRIAAYQGGQLTLDAPWNVTPDGSSTIVIGPYTDRVAVYQNYLDGKAGSATSAEHTASAGIEPYGGTFNFIADRNTLHELRQGISNWATQHNTGLDPNYFNLFTGNTFVQCRWAIFNRPDINRPLGTGILAAMYRRNQVQTALEAGILYSTTMVTDPVTDAMVFEHNTISDVPAGFLTVTGTDAPNGFTGWNRGAENLFFYHNSFSHGNAGGPSAALSVTPAIVLKDNSYQGFSQPYMDAFAETQLEAPVHALELGASGGSDPGQATLLLHNAGATPVSWKAATNASWLSLSATSGNMESEKDNNPVTVTANSQGLAPGKYPADITVTCRDRIRIYSVTLAVEQAAKATGRGLNYKLYRGSWDYLPDFNALAPEQTGITPNIDIGIRPAGEDDDFAFLWEGTISIPQAGTYTFETVSDDGSKFYFNTRYDGAATALVNNDGLHAMQASAASVYVPAAGNYPVAITFFEKTGYESMQLFWSGPGFTRQQVPDAAFNGSAVAGQAAGAGSIQLLADSLLLSAQVSVYPNPFEEYLYFNMSNLQKGDLLVAELFDAAGNMVCKIDYGRVAGTESMVKLPVNRKLAPGSYYLHIRVNNRAYATRKLVRK